MKILKHRRSACALACMMAAVSSVPFLSSAEAASAASSITSADPGRQLQDAQERMEQERILREMEEQKQQQAGGIEHHEAETPQKTAETRFVLKDVQVDASALLPEDVVKAAYAPYLDKEISIDDLYAIVQRLNDWYAKETYLTCRAYLPQQTIHAGVVRIALIEGRNGTVSITDNKTTSNRYIEKRLGITPGDIEKMSELQRRLDQFNGTNDVKLHITLQAGSAPGTTDYAIRAYEPQRDAWTLYADHAGSETTGRWRQGLFYTNRSLTGSRDALALSYLRAKGLDSFSAGYDTPVGRNGERFSFDYSTNATEVIDGYYADHGLSVKGHATYFGLTFRQPLAVSPRGKTEATLALSQTHSRTDFARFPWIDDTFRDITAAVARTDYGERWALYQKGAYTYGSWDNDSAYQAKSGNHYSILTFTGICQRGARAHGQQLTLRMNGQWSLTTDLRPSKQFFLGGATSVRGYPENEIGADRGMTLSAEYSVPMAKRLSMYTFLDYGKLWGEPAHAHTAFLGTGLGLRTQLFDGGSLDTAIGIPLRRDTDDGRVAGAQLHLSFVASF